MNEGTRNKEQGGGEGKREGTRQLKTERRAKVMIRVKKRGMGGRGEEEERGKGKREE